MAKQVLAGNRHRLWMFGQSYDLHVVTSTIALNAGDFSGPAGNPHRQQKTQIVLHCTAGNGSGEQVINWWNNPASGAASAHFVVERTWTGQAGRPPLPAGVQPPDNQDTGIVDVVRVMDEDTITYHGGMVNPNSIGIEHSNVGWGWFATTPAREPTLAGRHVPLATCPAPINIGSVANPRWVCNHARPQDENRFIHLPQPIGGHRDYQAYEEEQYMAMILLLRHLCIVHRIPRQFLGRTTEEVFRHWLYQPAADPARRRVNRSTIFHFRGIMHHRNCHRNKPCPGIIHRNRLYRGIIDEWWLPVQLDGAIRNYYSGPFAPHPFVAGNPTRPAYFRAGANGIITGVTYRNANLDALTEADSYYDVDRVENYYRQTETRRGGCFPVGTNRVWHGGIHLTVQAANPCVYAAASGTIVAARLSSHPDTDRHARFGSQRFVLIRHAVHLATQPDPDGEGTRIDYNPDPVYVFSLYMHLGPVEDLNAEHDRNPPWFNLWRRNNPAVNIAMTDDGEKGRVFAPDIKVSVGDILGHVGVFRGQEIVHFEVLTHQNNELTMAPWDDPALRSHDTNDNVICDVQTLDRFLVDTNGDGLDVIDVLRAAPSLRNVKAFHKSEWALTSADQIEALIPNARRRTIYWPHFRRFSWVPDAVAAYPDLTDQLGDGNGMFWHYHPITLIQHVNRLILGENREAREEEYTDTNVVIDEDSFFTDFVTWDPALVRFNSANADAQRLRAVFVSSDDRNHHPDRYVYHFTRNDIACAQPGPHAPGPTPPQSTRFSVALLQLVERIRVHYNATVNVELAYVCSTHNANPGLCSLNTPDAIRKHHEGIAIDIRPTALNNANCQSLWRSAAAILDPFSLVCQHQCGNPTQADLPEGYDGVRYEAQNPAVQAKLTAVPQQALTPAEVAAFRIHVELTEAPGPIARADTSLLPVELRVTFLTLEVLDDQDCFGAGEWNLQANVNGEPCGSFDDRSVRTGQTIPLGWTKTVTIHPERREALLISVAGVEDDPFFDDSLGSINQRYDQNSNPRWGIGTQTRISSNGSFKVNFKIESLNVEF